MDGQLLETLRKKALGYTASEQVTEYDSEGNETRQKITVKDIQPDMSALKMLIELDDTAEPTEAELEAEKKRLLGELKKYYGKNEKGIRS